MSTSPYMCEASLNFPSNGLVIVSWNINRLNDSKFQQIKLLLVSQQIDIILFLVETWRSIWSYELNFSFIFKCCTDKFVSHERCMMAACADQIAYIRLYICNIFYHFLSISRL